MTASVNCLRAIVDALIHEHFNSVLRCIGVAFLVLGVVRLLYVATIPSFSLIEVGLLALIYPSLPLGKLDARRLGGWKFLTVVVAASFLFKLLWVNITLWMFPQAVLDIQYYQPVVEQVAETFALPHDVWWEPLSIIVMAGLVRVGTPFFYLARVFIPGLSSLTLIPFFFVFRSFDRPEVASIATLLLAFSPLELSMLQIQMYRDIFAGFLLMVALYFTLTENQRIPAMTVLSAIALFLSHVVPSLLYLTTIFIYGLLHRKEKDGKRCAILFAVLAGTLLVSMPYFSPTIYSWLYNYVCSFTLAEAPLILSRIYFLRHALVPSAVLVVSTIPTLVYMNSSHATRHDLSLAMLLGLSLLSLPLLVGGYGKIPYLGGDQPLLVLWLDMQFPIAILAARTIEKNSRAGGFLLLVVLLIIASSLALISRYFY